MEISEAIQDKLAEVGQLWLADPSRPRLDEDVLEHWDSAILEWVEDSSLPLFVRKLDKGFGHGEPFAQHNLADS